MKAKGRHVGLENGSSKNKGSETLQNKTKENFYFYNHQGDHHVTIITMREVVCVYVCLLVVTVVM